VTLDRVVEPVVAAPEDEPAPAAIEPEPALEPEAAIEPVALLEPQAAAVVEPEVESPVQPEAEPAVMPAIATVVEEPEPEAVESEAPAELASEPPTAEEAEEAEEGESEPVATWGDLDMTPATALAEPTVAVSPTTDEPVEEAVMAEAANDEPEALPDLPEPPVEAEPAIPEQEVVAAVPVEAEPPLEPEPEPEPTLPERLAVSPELAPPEPEPEPRTFESPESLPEQAPALPVAQQAQTVGVESTSATMVRWPSGTSPGQSGNGTASSQSEGFEEATSIIPAWQPSETDSRRTVSLQALPPEVIASGAGFAAMLTFESGPFAGRIVALPSEMVTVGRAPDNDVVVGDPATSGHHGRIEVRIGSFWLSDLGSTNGTLVNGEPVIEKQLNDGDLIAIGQNTIRFTLES
jgi:hypothetical protein